MAGVKPRRRKRFTERQVLETAIRQGAVILCYRCKVPFTIDKWPVEAVALAIPDQHWVGFAQREHLHEFELEGPDTPANCRYSCEGAHKVVTFGTKATTAGSSKHRIDKAKRIARGGNKKRGRGFQKPPPGYKHDWGKRTMGKRP